MLKLKQLRFSGIGRFADEQVIDFEGLGNLIQVDGVNLNTGGSSGAGKSTVFKALDYLLGVNNVAATVLQSRLSKSPISVSAEFDLDGKPVSVSRVKGKLRVDYDGEVTVGSNELAEEKLAQLIAIPLKLFRPMFHKRQKEGGFFLNLTPAQMNDFLMECLGLGHLKEKLAILDKKEKDLTELFISLQAAQTTTQEGLKATQEAILSLGLAPIQDMHADVVGQLKSRAAISATNLSLILEKQKLEYDSAAATRPAGTALAPDTRVAELSAKVAEVVREISGLELEEQNRVMKANIVLNTIRTEISRQKAIAVTGVMALAKARVLAEQVKTLREHKCFTCNQTWLHDSSKETENKLVADINMLKVEIENGKIASAALEQLESTERRESEAGQPRPLVGLDELNVKRKQLLDQINTIQTEERTLYAENNSANSARNAEFDAKLATLREKQAKDSEQARGQLEIDRRAFEAASARLQAYTDSKMRYDAIIASLKERETVYTRHLSERKEKYDSVETELKIVGELKKATKNYMSCSFDDALDSIGESATSLIRNIPNMANSTIQLEGVKETKEGKIKEQVNAVINMEGDENVPIASLCGGEETAVFLAVDLAVIDLIENRTNKGMNIFILDEPFNGLDTVCIEMALEVLKNSNSNKHLVVVDHNPIIKEAISNRIVVTRSGDSSKIG